MLDAAELAGLNVLSLINENSAGWMLLCCAVLLPC